MPLIDELKEKLVKSIKNGTEEKNLLRVIIGETQRGNTFGNYSLSDDDVKKVIKKIITNNRETCSKLCQNGRSDEKLTLENENLYLMSLLPGILDYSGVLLELNIVRELILGARNEGQAVGLANKHLKSKSFDYFGEDVVNAVKAIRDGN